jgi:hypothetical protein
MGFSSLLSIKRTNPLLDSSQHLGLSLGPFIEVFVCPKL